jgi:N-acetylmuramoyl-L-alanine amidase
MMSSWDDRLNDNINWKESENESWESLELPGTDLDNDQHSTKQDTARLSRVPDFARSDYPKYRTGVRIPVELVGLMLLFISIGAAGIAISAQERGSESSNEEHVSPVVISAAASNVAESGDAESNDNTDPFPEIAGDFQGVTVCLDAGHGGADRGFSHPGSADSVAMEEAPLTLLLTGELATRLEDAGFTVVLPRTEDSEVNAAAEDTNHDGTRSAGATPIAGQVIPEDPDEVQARINVCNEADADLLVSLHIGSSGDLDQRGSIIWYSGSQTFAPLSKLLAALIATETSDELTAVGYTGPTPVLMDIDDVANHDELTSDMLIIASGQPALNKASQMPGAFAEILTISNDADASDLERPEIRTAIVNGYLRAIERYAVQMISVWRSMQESQ